MIGVYKLDVDVWNLEFPVTMSVRYYSGANRMSVWLMDSERAPLRTIYYGPLLGFGGRERVHEIREWLHKLKPSGLNERALNSIGSLLAELWISRFDKDPPDPHRVETQV